MTAGGIEREIVAHVSALALRLVPCDGRKEEEPEEVEEEDGRRRRRPTEGCDFLDYKREKESSRCFSLKHLYRRTHALKDKLPRYFCSHTSVTSFPVLAEEVNTLKSPWCVSLWYF